MSHPRITFIAIAVACALGGTAEATTLIKVCPSCTLNTIQKGIEAANPTDAPVIQIAPGVYNEDIHVSGKGLTLQAVPGTVELRGTGSGPTVTLGSGGGATFPVTINGLTISNGKSLTIGSPSGGGIFVIPGSILHLKNSIVQNNQAFNGGGISVFTPRSPATTIEDSTITNNQAEDGAGISILSSVVTISNTDVTHNVGKPGFNADARGGGLFVGENGDLRLNRVTVSHNSAFEGGGIYAENDAHNTDIRRSTISENTFLNTCNGPVGCKPGFGIGAFLASSFIIADSTIAHNTGSSPVSLFGGGLYIEPNGTMSIDQATVGYNNTADASLNDVKTGKVLGGGGGIAIVNKNGNPARVTLSDVFVINNAASPSQAGGIDNSNSGQMMLTDVTIKDNTGDNCRGADCP